MSLMVSRVVTLLSILSTIVCTLPSIATSLHLFYSISRNVYCHDNIIIIIFIIIIKSIIAMLVSVHNSIGNVCQSEQRYDEALQHYHTSLDVLMECLSADHPIIASIHNNCGIVLSQQQEYNSLKQA